MVCRSKLNYLTEQRGNYNDHEKYEISVELNFVFKSSYFEKFKSFPLKSSYCFEMGYFNPTSHKNDSWKKMSVCGKERKAIMRNCIT